MVRLPRAEVFDPAEVEVAHVFSRTVRRCFLFGEDPVSRKNFDHRKLWIEAYLQQFAAAFGVDLLGYAILSSHFYLILRTRPDVVATWDDREVARRWLMLCPLNRKPDGTPADPSEPEINSIAGCPVKTAEIRKRLSSISWWMRLLCQRVAMRANREDGESGRFFQDRYKATKLVDEASLLACAAYVDLNPIRAAMAETIEESDFTSAQRSMREAGLIVSGDAQDVASEKDETVDEVNGSTPQAANSDEGSPVGDAETGAMDQRLIERSTDAARTASPDRSFLSPLFIDEAIDPAGPCASTTGTRCSDKGFLPMPLMDYIALLDWTARQAVAGKRGKTPEHVPPLLQRLGLDEASWSELVVDFGKLFGSVAGQAETVDALRSRQHHRRFHLRRRARELMTAA